jgi:hypothetical protein
MMTFAALALAALGLTLQQPPEGALPPEHAAAPAEVNRPPAVPTPPPPAPELAPTSPSAPYPLPPMAPGAMPPGWQWQPPTSAQLSQSPTVAPASLPRTGLFGVGLGIDLLQLGPLQVISSGGSSQGLVVGTGVEIDLGPRTALRIPIEIAYAGSSSNDNNGVERSTVFTFAALSPGLIYRFRTERHQRWTAYVGGAARLGGFLFGRALLGAAPNPPPATTQEFTRLGAAPDLIAGALFTPSRWFSLRIALDYTYIFVAHTNVQVLSETIAPRFSF